MRSAYFFRTCAPDGPDGGLGAMVQFFRGLDWDTMTVLYTDKAWPTSTAQEFMSLWRGEHAALGRTESHGGSDAWTGRIAYNHAITTTDGNVDIASVDQALAYIESPNVNSKIIFLIAHAEDAVHILKRAIEKNFQPESVWVGPGSWPGEVAVRVVCDWFSQPFPEANMTAASVHLYQTLSHLI